MRTQKLKPVFWFIYLSLAIDITFRFQLLGSHGEFGVLFLFGILPIGYIIHIMLFEHRKR